MIPNMKFYVVSIAAIFLALGIGIYIGFIMDSQELVVDQREGIIADIEENFNFLSDENDELRSSLELEINKNSNYDYFINSTYTEIIKDKLFGANVVIIETNNDYMYSGVGQILEEAGANVLNIITLSDKIMDEESLNILYDEQLIIRDDNNIIIDAIKKLMEAISIGETTDFVSALMGNEFINVIGLFNEPIDYIIIAGGSIDDSSERIELVDSTIVNIANRMSIPIFGIEKLETEYSYMERYKDLGITTVDNIDTTMGKVALILAMEGRPGNYGQKNSSEELIPNIHIPLAENLEE